MRYRPSFARWVAPRALRDPRVGSSICWFFPFRISAHERKTQEDICELYQTADPSLFVTQRLVIDAALRQSDYKPCCPIPCTICRGRWHAHGTQSGTRSPYPPGPSPRARTTPRCGPANHARTRSDTRPDQQCSPPREAHARRILYGSGVQANLVGRNTIEPLGLELGLLEILCGVPGVLLRRVEVVQEYDGEGAIVYFLKLSGGSAALAPSPLRMPFCASRPIPVDRSTPAIWRACLNEAYWQAPVSPPVVAHPGMTVRGQRIVQCAAGDQTVSILLGRGLLQASRASCLWSRFGADVDFEFVSWRCSLGTVAPSRSSTGDTEN
ncbi:hypothetical protein VTO73DRAFT_8902 [Trametes versicolor]